MNYSYAVNNETLLMGFVNAAMNHNKFKMSKQNCLTALSENANRLNANLLDIQYIVRISNVGDENYHQFCQVHHIDTGPCMRC